MDEKIKLGVSACLLGQKVRYDGGHKRDRFITDTLSLYVEYVPVCPEVEYGLGIPREALRLVGDPSSPRLVTTKTHHDHTDRMLQYARKRVIELSKENLCGFIFKSKSPSSGMERVKVYNEKGMPVNKGVGLFARVFMEHFPLIPVEEEGRLHDPKLRENFIESIFALKRWREAIAGKMRLNTLVDFHTRHKLMIMSHSPKHFEMMEKLIRQARRLSRENLFGAYQRFLGETLRLKATQRKNTNALKKLAALFNKQISKKERGELLHRINRYAQGLAPLQKVITSLNKYIRKYPQSGLASQFCLGR